MGPLETVESSKAAPGAGQESGGGQPRRKSRWLVWLLFLAVLGYGGWRFYTARAKGQAADPPAGGRGRAANLVVPVVVATAARADLPIYLNGLGSVTAFNTVTIHSRVDGQLVNVAFAEGQIVHEGDLLAQIDARPFQVQLEQVAELGRVAREQPLGPHEHHPRLAAANQPGVIPQQQAA